MVRRKDREGRKDRQTYTRFNHPGGLIYKALFSSIMYVYTKSLVLYSGHSCSGTPSNSYQN